MNPQELFQLYFLMSQALNSTVIVVEKHCSFPMSAVTLYEAVELLDDNGKPTGKTVPMVTLTSGKEIDLTPAQNEVFKTLWNQKGNIDDKLRAVVTQLDAQIFPPNQLALQPQPAMA